MHLLIFSRLNIYSFEAALTNIIFPDRRQEVVTFQIPLLAKLTLVCHEIID